MHKYSTVYIYTEKYQICTLKKLTELLKFYFRLVVFLVFEKIYARRSPYASLSINIIYTDSMFIMKT